MKIEPFVNLSILPNGDLLIELDEEARQEVEEISQNERWDSDTKLAEVLEYWRCNSEYELLSNLVTNDLFTGPIICLQCDWTDQGDLLGMKEKWGYADHQIYDPVTKLLEDGRLIFSRAEEYKEDAA